MPSEAIFLITLGVLFLIGLVTHYIGQHTFVPRVSALLLFGFTLGPFGFDIMPNLGESWFPRVADMALVMVGFMLGSSMNRDALILCGRRVLSFSLSVAIASSLIVCLGLYLIGVPLHLALLLGGIASATDPAATADVVRESHAGGPFSQTLLGIVAVDDAWGLIIFSLMLAAAQVVVGAGGPLAVCLHGLWEIGGALLIGVLIGVPMSYLTGRIQPGEPTLVEVLGLLFLCQGIALYLHVSYLLAAMTMGAVVSNVARHHKRPFHAIENIQWPLLVLFFIFAGASVRMEGNGGIIGVTAAYCALRVLGRLVGALVGGWLCRAQRHFSLLMSMALMPQAGVALGMALVGAMAFSMEHFMLPVVVAATVVFEIVGPMLTRIALKRMGESGVDNADRS
ncbi:Kef-type K+ transport system membrane component KefB [Desulfobaculum xiamenense]|uniref:Kef-type K+ transport system membrane component KefB n=1 Tax=Desulfobaculum xiamenense TaxID=995050 RepID=A0A846QNC9_9BACT|nr:cation:proton antiporter [Desulfobaculum xiamenense]NJB67773.1 Kef-type K+ transport system membrane component KefB [Desulfobaculum xiamenense]